MKNILKKLFTKLKVSDPLIDSSTAILFEGPERKVVMTFKQRSGAKNFRCMICGYLGLERRQFENMPDKADPKLVTPPYYDSWGEASYEVCACCGYEAGNDDSFSTDKNFPTKFLLEWVEEGQNWIMPDERSTDWSLKQQLNEAGIPVPVELK